jgi:sodium transport system ATP-binding protein
MVEVKGLSKTFAVRRKKARGLGLFSRASAIPVEPQRAGRYFYAVKDVSFSAKAGAILGLLGPNGAGKTTLLRMLSTSLKPSAGTADFDGVDLVASPLEVRRKIGFLSDNTGLYGRLTAREMVEYFGKLYGLEQKKLRQRMDELFTVLEMRDFADKRNDLLSSGMKQKVSIVRTLIHDPQVIMFDEPTTGLDVAAAETILKFIESCKDRGKTVIFCTHHMHEVDRLCDSIVVLNNGRVCFDGNIEQMYLTTGQNRTDKAFLALIDAGKVNNAA